MKTVNGSLTYIKKLKKELKFHTDQQAAWHIINNWSVFDPNIVLYAYEIVKKTSEINRLPQ